jgi:hypothetical protein
MKKIALLSLMFVTLFAGTTFAAEMKSANPVIEGVWIKVMFVFHKPKTNCLTGFGICIDLSGGIEKPVGNQPMCQAKVRINGNNQLVIEVTEQALQSYENGNTLTYFRNKSSVTFEEPYTLSSETARALGANGPVTIKAGTYPVSYEKGTYTMTIQL